MDENPYRAPNDLGSNESEEHSEEPEMMKSSSLEDTILLSVAWAIALLLLVAAISAGL